jgi:hypothetical protein
VVLIVNKGPSVLDAAAVKASVEQAYDCPVVAALRHSGEPFLQPCGGRACPEESKYLPAGGARVEPSLPPDPKQVHERLTALGSSGVFALRYPDHPVTDMYKQTAVRLMA